MGLLDYVKKIIGRRIRSKRKSKLIGGAIYTQDKNQTRLYSHKKERVIIANSTFGNTSITNGDIYFYNLLKRYGYNVLFSVCDGTLSACSMCERGAGLKSIISINQIKEIQCKGCIELFEQTKKELNIGNSIEKAMGIKDETSRRDIELFISEWNNSGAIEDFRGVNVHEHTLSSLARYLGKPIKREELVKDKRISSDYKIYLESACITVVKWQKLIRERSPSHIIINHGLYIPQGVIMEVANKLGIKTSIWHHGYRKNTFLISKRDTYHKTLLEELDYRSSILSKEKKDKILGYLESRRTGKDDQISFVHKDAERKRISFGEKSKNYNKVCLILTNVGWDAQCHYENNVYSSMNEWLLDILNIAKNEKNHLFVFRCHPAEVTGRRVATEKTSTFIKRNAKGLNNVVIISSSNKASTYKIIERSDFCIVYATKTAVEAICMNKPVLICGESCLKNKGLTLDLDKRENIENYYKQLENTKVDLEGAYSYAYKLFFDTMKDFGGKNREECEQNEQEIIGRLIW